MSDLLSPHCGCGCRPADCEPGCPCKECQPGPGIDRDTPHGDVAVRLRLQDLLTRDHLSRAQEAELDKLLGLYTST